MADDMVSEMALDWAVRTGDPAFADWDAFMVWLEADPSHSRAYDKVSAAIADASDRVASAGPANDDQADEMLPSRRRPWLIGGIAAALTVIAAIWVLRGQERDLYTVQTAAAETRVIALDAATRIELAGGSALSIDRKDKRFAKLEHGQALFSVRHDAAHPFEVIVGEDRLIDLGTMFDVRRDRDGLVVAVAEGAVQFDPDGAKVNIAPGQVLRRLGTSDYIVSSMPVEQVGEWREGRLTFEGAPLSEVAAQLSRATGIDYRARGSGTVSGSILIPALRKDPAGVGLLLGLAVRAEGNHWILGAR